MSTVYLIPAVLYENAIHTILPATVTAVMDCQVIFAEKERTARRFLKSIKNDIVIDHYQWRTIHNAGPEVKSDFLNFLKEGKNIGIISEAGCPGIADPGQILVEAAHAAGATVKPLVGPSSILLAVMASGLNGQHFCFEGYLPIEQSARIKALKHLESESSRKNCTQIFIETPYRNNQLFETMISACNPRTRLCVAADLTAPSEWIRTKEIDEWRRREKPDLHKRPVVFCLLAR